MCRLSWNLGASNSWNSQGLSRPVMGLLYLYKKKGTCQIKQNTWTLNSILKNIEGSEQLNSEIWRWVNDFIANVFVKGVRLIETSSNAAVTAFHHVGGLHLSVFRVCFLLWFNILYFTEILKVPPSSFCPGLAPSENMSSRTTEFLSWNKILSICLQTLSDYWCKECQLST